MIGMIIGGSGARVQNVVAKNGSSFDPVIQVSDADQFTLDGVKIPFGQVSGVDVVRGTGFTSATKPRGHISNVQINGSGVTTYCFRVRSTGTQKDYWLDIVNLEVDLSDANGIEIDDVEGVSIFNFRALLCQRHGLYVNDAKRCRFSGMVEASGLETNNTYDNIHVTGTSSANWFSLHSFIRPAATNDPRYGMFFDTNTLDNIESSDLRDSGVTADYSDLGTNNRTTDEHLADGGSGGAGADPTVTSQLAVFAFQGDLDSVTIPYQGTSRFVFPFDATILGVTAAVGGGDPTGASILVDVHKNGTTIFTTQANRPEIAVSTDQSAHEVPDVSAVSAGEYITIDIDQVGSTLPGTDLTVIVEWRVA